MGKFRGLRLLAIAASFGLAGTSSVLAGGEFFQFDFAPGASTVVVSVVRGPTGVALGWSEYDSGSALSANAPYSFGLTAQGEGHCSGSVLPSGSIRTRNWIWALTGR